MKMRGNLSWARTATLLLAFLFCAVLLTGCNSTHEVFVLMNDGEYKDAYRTFRDLPDEEQEELLEETNAYIQSTVTQFTNGEITLKVALRRFDSINNFRMSDLNEPLETAVNSVLEAYTVQITEESDEIDLQKTLEAFVEISELYPFHKLSVNPLTASQETIIKTYIDSEMAKVYGGTLEYSELYSSLSFLQGAEYSLAMDAITAYETKQKTEAAYTAGKESYENGDYENAVSQLSVIPSDDSRYEEVSKMIDDAKSKILKSKLEEAQQYADNGFYDSALSILNKLLEDGYDYVTVSGKINEYEAAKTEQELLAELEQLIAAARRLVEKGDYEQALGSLSNFTEEYYIVASDEILNQAQEAYSEIENSYVTMIANKVEALRAAGDYLSAMNMLNNAIVSNERLNQLRARIEAEKPVYLCEMTDVLVNSEQYSQVTDRIPTDTIGNRYTSANVYSTTADYWNEGYAEYYLGYRYDTLTGILAPCNTSVNQRRTFRIVSDDGKVLFETDLSRTTTPITLELDVSAANFIKFELVGGSNSEEFTALLIDFAFTKSET